MNVWLVNPYGPLPDEGWRDYRFAMLGKALAGNGHSVVWWTANFSHHFKRYRSTGWRDIRVCPGFDIRLVPTTAYFKNVSFGRLRYEAIFAWRMRRAALESPKPDIIIGTDPSQIIGRACVNLSRCLDVPLMLDVFDLWPELFSLAVPAPLRPAAPALFYPFTALRRANLRAADAVVSLCETYMQVARRETPALSPNRTAVIFNGINVSRQRQIIAEARADAQLRWPKRHGETRAVYAGTLGNNYDVSTLIESADILRKRSRTIRLYVAGVGPLLEQVQRYVARRPNGNLTYVGSLKPNELAGLYGTADVGLCAYSAQSNVAMPDKAYDYMAAGLPIISSLKGELADLLRTNGFGLAYASGDASSLVQALETVAGDSKLRGEMATRSGTAADTFDQGVQYARYVKFIESIVGLAASDETIAHV